MQFVQQKTNDWGEKYEKFPRNGTAILQNPNRKLTKTKHESVQNIQN